MNKVDVLKKNRIESSLQCNNKHVEVIEALRVIIKFCCF